MSHGGVGVKNQTKEKLRQEEWKKDPTGAMRDGFERGNAGSLTELVSGLGFKGFLAVIVVITVVFLLTTFL